MSVTKILSELPKLAPAELEQVFPRALELHEKIEYEASPELLRAIEEADATPQGQDVSIEEAYRIIKSWDTK